MRAPPATPRADSVVSVGDRGTADGETAVLVPVKAFSDAKVRLAAVLDGAERERLARALADVVVTAAGPLPVWVVCDDEAVADWARQRGAAVIWSPARGLNGAVTDGVSHLGRLGFETAVVAHADLPLVTELASIPLRGTVVLAPDRRSDGTNVAAVPTGCAFTFSYGPGSFQRHCLEAARLGLPLEIRQRDDLAWDVDIPDDLAYLTRGVVGER